MKTPALLVAFALAAAGCSSVHVSTDYDRDVDFSALRTFAWRTPDPGERDGFRGNTIVRKRVDSAIERELESKGFSRATGAADFVIAIHAYARDRVDVTTWPEWGYGWGRRRSFASFGYDRVEVSQWTEGSLVVDFVRTASKELIWRGIATAAVDASSGSPERVDEAIHKLLEGFPPK